MFGVSEMFCIFNLSNNQTKFSIMTNTMNFSDLVQSNNEFFVGGKWISEAAADMKLDRGIYRLSGDVSGFWIQETTGHYVFENADQAAEQIAILEQVIPVMENRNDPDVDRYLWQLNMFRIALSNF